MSSLGSTSSPAPSISKLNLPPSPPESPKRCYSPPRLAPVDRVLGTLHLLHAGRAASSLRLNELKEFVLSPNEFGALRRRIDEDTALAGFHNAKVRWEYESGVCTLRMPSVVHEIFTARVNDGIQAAIEALGERLGGKARDALKGVKKGGSPTLRLEGPAPLSGSSQETGEEVLVETYRSPDGTFFHREGKWPCVVLEVSFSQAGRKLDRIAESYVVDSFGGIRCVVGLELPYVRKNTKGRTCVDNTARVSVWRANVEQDEDGIDTLSCARAMQRTPFVDQCGVNQAGQLELSIADLLPPNVLDTLDGEVRDEKITLPFSDLAAFLKDANRAQELDGEKFETDSKPSMKRKKRRRTPEEELDEEREAKFKRLEDAEVSREQRESRAWRNPRAESGTREPERRRSQRLSLRVGTTS